MISHLLIETAQFPSFLLKNWPPWESKIFLGGFWHLFQLKFEEISPKIPRMQILRKLAPLLPPPHYSPPWPPWGQKKFSGGFWHLSQLNFEEISPKIPRMQILRKLAPLLVPRLLSPLSTLGIKTIFGRFLASISAQV